MQQMDPKLKIVISLIILVFWDLYIYYRLLRASVFRSRAIVIASLMLLFFFIVILIHLTIIREALEQVSLFYCILVAGIWFICLSCFLWFLMSLFVPFLYVKLSRVHANFLFGGWLWFFCLVSHAPIERFSWTAIPFNDYLK